MHYDPLVIDAVERVRDRFGSAGLRDLIALAQQEIARVEAAWASLSTDAEVEQEPQGMGDETREFRRFVAEGERADDQF